MGKLVIKELTKQFGDVTAVNHVSLTVEDGEMLTVVGPSGCGKTTILRMGVKDGSGASIPLYEDLRKKLLKDYSRLTYYAPFPSEREICESYGVSRPTVRTALDLMEQDGDIVRLPRKGTFFLGNQPFTDHQLSSAGGFFNDVRLQGRETTSRVLFQNIDHGMP